MISLLLIPLGLVVWILCYGPMFDGPGDGAVDHPGIAASHSPRSTAAEYLMGLQGPDEEESGAAATGQDRFGQV
ncbi:MAG TPA: hypothetical protein VME92_11275 [Acetobacteraceae bacterium]|nr:hypothetical protein [Acetobacteraceae bacterium]